MRRFALFIVLIVISSSIDYLAGQDMRKILIITEERVIFDKPGFKNNAVTMVAKGERVTLIKAGTEREEYRNFNEVWYYVKTSSGMTGWIYGAFVNDPVQKDNQAEGNQRDSLNTSGDVPRTIQLKATAIPFKDKQSVLKASESQRYRYAEYAFSKKEHLLLGDRGFFIKNISDKRLPYIETDDMVDLYNAYSGVQKPQDVIQLTEIDNVPEYSTTPLFISGDYLLHLYHVLFMRMVEDIEKKKFYPILKSLTESLAKEALKQYRLASDARIKESYKKVAAFFCVPASIMGMNIEDADIASLISSDISSIKSASGFGNSSVTGEPEDFSQYKPRGHYNKEDTLRTYFKVMMWYGRIYFPADKPLPAVMITGLLSKKENLEKWEAIYIPTSYLVGRSDDLDVYDLQPAIKKILGSAVPPGTCPDDASLKKLSEHLKTLKNPRIISTKTVYGEKNPSLKEAQDMTRGFRFMGQRFIPDSYIFTMFTSPRIGSLDRPRNFPRGLDVMAILGSAECEKLLQKEINEIPGFDDQYRTIKKEFEKYDENTFSQNIYWGWLNCIRSLFDKPGAKLPKFMQAPDWKYRLVLAAHGSWAELRHDTILYAKQSYAEMGGPEPETVYYAGQPRIPRGFVEPNPLYFKRLLNLINMTIKKLNDARVLTDEYREKLGIFKGVVSSLSDIAEKEVKDASISDDEFMYIGNCTKNLAGIVLPRGEVFMDDTYKKMAVVADVHTDSQSQQVLEVGVGKPKEIFMFVKDRNGARICVGFVYSYYEFKAPMSGRLTDEEWRQKIYSPSGQNYLQQREPSWLKLIPSAD